ncbi:ribonucleotide reductase subunit alpha [Dyella sp. A6]|uniref:ribonucleotide reductase subunit alpha n=1 Tax=Dyella aluminiiresistens TaxID=3069105 RepID=UPI002E767073|nr:ribonucleotide reductase subunit alpha [Dyella sp. A6]
MTLTSFQDLLDASLQQPQPQRLLFVFVTIDLPEAATEAQRVQAARKTGGNLSPTLCVDKAPDEVASFSALVEESNSTGLRWEIVFVSSMSGRAGVAPSADEAAQPLRFMVNAINNGRVSEFVAFDREGNVLQFL